MRRRPNRGEIVELEDELSKNRVSDEVLSKPSRLKKKSKDSPKEMQFKKKLRNEDFKSFNNQDWLRYFQHKSRQQGVNYRIHDYMKANAIMKSVMTKFSPIELRNMIDFIYESGQDSFDYRSNAVIALSKAWLDFTESNTNLWMDGKFKTKTQKSAERNNKPKRNREWSGERQVKDEVITVGSSITI